MTSIFGRLIYSNIGKQQKNLSREEKIGRLVEHKHNDGGKCGDGDGQGWGGMGRGYEWVGNGPAWGGTYG